MVTFFTGRYSESDRTIKTGFGPGLRIYRVPDEVRIDVIQPGWLNAFLRIEVSDKVSISDLFQWSGDKLPAQVVIRLIEKYWL